MEMTQGNTLYNYSSNQTEMYFFFTKMQNRKAKQVLSGGLVPVEGVRIQGKGIGG
jgi:hypothetical protein